MTVNKAHLPGSPGKRLSLLLIPAAVLLYLVFAGSAFAATITWTGQGTTNGYCNTIFDDPGVPVGQQVWQFNLTNGDGGTSTLTYLFSDGTSGTTTADPIGGSGTYHFFVTTTEGAQLISASATNGTSGSQLTVSHCYVNPGAQAESTISTEVHTKHERAVDNANPAPYGATVHDQVTLQVTGATTWTGTLTLNFFTNNDCSAPAADSTSFTWSDTDPSTQDGLLPEGPLTAGGYSYQASFDSSDNSLDKVGDCEPFVVKRNPEEVVSITKTADTSFRRDCSWTIDKSVDRDTATALPGQPATFNYTVDVTKDCVDSGWNVSGKITITNNDTDFTYKVKEVTDSLGDGIVDCSPAVLPVVLAPTESLTCSYSFNPTSGDDGVNVASAKVDLTWISSEPVPFSFTNPDPDTGECASVDDTQGGHLGDPCESTTFNYSKDYAAADCGTERKVDNTATVTWNGGADSDDDSVTVTVLSRCFGKTMGFWGNKNGQALITNSTGVLPYTLGDSTKCHVDVTKTNSKTIFPTTLNGLSLANGTCTPLDAGINTNSANVLLAQTLAMYLNSKLIAGYKFNTIGDLGCTSYIGVNTDLTSSSDIAAILSYANTLIGNLKTGGVVVTQQQVGDLNALLGCMNRES